MGSPGPAGAASPDASGRYLLVLTLLALLSGGLFVASLFTGRSAAPLLDLFIGGSVDDAYTLWLIFNEIRLPRALLATAVGATLGLSGAALQGYLRNPLAEPGLVGASSAAAFGAVLMLYTGASAWFPMALPLGGIAGAIIGLALVTLLAGGGSGALTLILAGVAVNSFAAALTSLALNLAPSPYAALEIVFWLLGSLADRSFEHVRVALPFMLLGWVLLLRLGRALDALSIGEEAASSLGYRLPRLRWLLLLGVGLSVGASVAVAGAIGFIGLVVPHLLRPLVGHRPGALLPASALGGAALTLAADIGVRLLSPGPELKLGVLTALIGAPFFLYLLVGMRRTGQ
ncbi:MAG: iron ABC transporter permease [Gammaproteobacteria bacterium]|nr:MAG: iron ABC transporter permease [Gammaproteobacteria bacterium]